ncbi:hypothetical protein [Streptomyces gilvosporeus]|uniref:DUF304 domain-containing protein n=1 Tax=Streptomyces gilvosporeus TaxID=553510 RepID=A0A1V0TQ27_9ACTN|nr:hypothetical protein [Streptomyces gilvosporeus]ARF55056.1 hypothetical protein B1H19_13315 [Streptomyces gilvosporeus]
MSRGDALRRLAAHEARWLTGLWWWVARRRIGVGAGERALPYAAGQAAMVYGLTFVCVVETVGLHVMLAGAPVARWVLLVVDVYTVLMMLGFQASAVTRPHVLGAEGLLLRDGARREIRLPLQRIASVGHDLRFSEKREEGVLHMAVGGQTSVTVELAEPVVAVRLLGRQEVVRTVRFHADDARGAVAAVRAAVTAAAGAGSRVGEAAIRG